MSSGALPRLERLEGPAAAAAAGKQVTDTLYGSYKELPTLTNAGGSLVDPRRRRPRALAR